MEPGAKAVETSIGPSYVEQPRVFGVIVGSFFVVFLPLTFLALVPNDFRWLPHVFLLQAVGLGVTHFFITLALYANRDNLRYFNQGLRNRAIYFGVPLLCFTVFAALSLPSLKAAPFFALFFFPLIRVFDFLHVGRQSFGVAQLLKRSLSDLPRSLRQLENAVFIGLALLQWQTFLGGGRFRSDALSSVLPASVVALLLLALVGGYLRHAATTGGAARIYKPLVYVLLQAACAAAAVYQTRLYLIALTMHYLEYHLLMGPRLFATSGGGAAGAEAAPNVPAEPRPLRARVIVFYLGLLAVVVLFEAKNHTPVPESLLPAVHAFDGIFLVHFFLEAFLWKFSSPHYRRTLGPLYLANRQGPADGGTPAAARRSRGPSLVELAWAGAIAITISVVLLRATNLDAAIERKLLGPMIAQHRIDWAIDLAKQNQLEAAMRQLERAVLADPGNQRAQRALEKMRLLAETRAGAAEK